MKIPKRSSQSSQSPLLYEQLKYLEGMLKQLWYLDTLNRRRGEIGVGVSTVVLASLIAAGITKINNMLDALTNPPRREIEFLPENFGLNHQDLEMKTIDHKSVSGWLIDPERNGGKKTDKIVILSHGYGMNRASHEEILNIAKRLVKNGIACILFDFENHGLMKGEKTSDDGRTTIGVKTEKNDLHAVIDHAKESGFEKIGLIGISMGAATSLEVAAERDDVQMVVADSSFYDLGPYLLEQISYWNEQLKPWMLTYLFKYAKITKDLDVKKMRPIEAIKKLGARGVDVKIIHTETDEVTPVTHGRRLAEAYCESYNQNFEVTNQPKTQEDVLMTTDGIGKDEEQHNHCRSIDVDHNGYLRFAIDPIIRLLGTIEPKPLQIHNPTQIDGPNKASRPFKYTGKHRDSPNIRRVGSMKKALKTILFKPTTLTHHNEPHLSQIDRSL